MFDARLETLAQLPPSPGLALGNTGKYEGSDTPNLPYYRRSRKRSEEKKKQNEPPKDPSHTVDFVA